MLRARAQVSTPFRYVERERRGLLEEHMNLMVVQLQQAGHTVTLRREVIGSFPSSE